MINLRIVNIACAESIGGMTNVVAYIDWQASEETNKTDELGEKQRVYINGRTMLSAPSPDSFIEYSSLTEDDVRQWILGSESYSDALPRLAKAVEEANLPPLILLPPPWSN